MPDQPTARTRRRSTSPAGPMPDDRNGTGPGEPTDTDPPTRAGRPARTPGRPPALVAATRMMPSGPVPVALAAGALAIAGIVEWPVAAAVGVGYLAVRRWR